MRTDANRPSVFVSALPCRSTVFGGTPSGTILRKSYKYRNNGIAIGEKMESALWAINLVVLVFVCFWAIRQDKLELEAETMRENEK
jgi:hypothetical protein